MEFSLLTLPAVVTWFYARGRSSWNHKDLGVIWLTWHCSRDLLSWIACCPSSDLNCHPLWPSHHGRRRASQPQDCTFQNSWGGCSGCCSSGWQVGLPAQAPPTSLPHILELNCQHPTLVRSIWRDLTGCNGNEVSAIKGKWVMRWMGMLAWLRRDPGRSGLTSFWELSGEPWAVLLQL